MAGSTSPPQQAVQSIKKELRQRLDQLVNEGKRLKVKTAVTELLLADELEVAFGIASGQQLKYAAILLVHRCEVHQLWEAGAHFARLSGSKEEV